MRITRFGAVIAAISCFAQPVLAADVRVGDSATIRVATRLNSSERDVSIGKAPKDQLVGGTLIIGLLAAVATAGVAALVSSHKNHKSNPVSP